MLEAVYMVAQTIGGAASVPLLVILWRLDRRISKLETIVEMMLLRGRSNVDHR